MANIPRPPIVTIMGHVDHGKTTLLDTIRKTRVAQTETGGITQHIGAYQVVHQNKKITFIDTPGHAAFIDMRRQGAKVTDIIVLIISGTEGVKPQTVESIKHIQASNCQVVVCITKKDLPSFSADMVKAQLTEHQIFCDGYGGQVPVVEVSAYTNQGIDELLDIILLVADMEELTADTEAPVEAVVIESKMDKNRGPSASVIINQGTLSLGDTVYDDQIAVKIRAMFDEHNSLQKQALPGQPVEIIGFKTVPQVGSLICTQKPELVPPTPSVTTSNTSTPSEEVTEEEMLPTYNIIIKADTRGTLEAIKTSISSDIVIIDASVGPVTESDMLLADSTNAEIIAFRVLVSPAAKRLSEIEHINIYSYTIIYKLLEFLEEKILKIMEPTIDEIELGQAKVAAIFEMKKERIAGCKVVSGEIAKNHLFHLYRDDKIIAHPKIRSLKRGKEDVAQIKVGNECGIVFSGHIDFQVGDVLKSYKKNN